MSNKEKVNVILDANEASQNPALMEVLTLHEDVEDYEIKPLSEGDIIIDGCMFERKTPSDFASSLQEGRLRDQVERMAGSDYHPFVLIEGNMEDFDNLSHTNIGGKSLRGMYASIEMKNGVGVKYCSTIELLADEAVRLARKEKEDVNRVQARQTEAVKDPTFIEEVFLAVEGVGVKTAEKLAEKYTSLSEVLEETPDGFQQVEDVGEVTAQEIYDTVHSSSNKSQESTDSSKKVYEI